MKLASALQRDMERAKEDLFRTHRADPNFTGCGIGLRRRGGEVTDEVVIVAMVQDKLPAGAVSRRWLLPKTVTGDSGATHAVDVVEVGRVFAASGSASQVAPASSTLGPATYTGAYHPPIQGSSISLADPTLYPSNTDHGTFGCLVRDLTDHTICVLSANHVIAEIDDVSAGTKIIQPATVDGGTEADAFATLKRFVKLDTDTGTPATVDAAIAQLTDQTTYSQATVSDKMAPISAAHPAVGMAIAYDLSGNSFLTRMDATLEQLNCELLPATPGSPCVVAPEIGVNIEKVGRTSGYTSSTIDAISVQVKIAFAGEDTLDYDDVTEEVTLSDLIWSQFFLIGGDSGAVACVGGDGGTFVIVNAQNCPLLSGAQDYYGLPSTTSDNQLTNAVQDVFLSQSQTGTLLVGAVYLNKDTVAARLGQDTGSAYGQPAAQAAAQSYYGSYRDLIADDMADADSTTTVTPVSVQDSVNLVLDTTGYHYDATAGTYTVTGPYTLEEAQASYILTYMLGHAMSGNGTDPGMTRAQAVEYLDQGNVYNIVYNTLRRVPTYVLP